MSMAHFRTSKGAAVSEWCSDPIYRQLCDEMLIDPLPPAEPAEPAEPVDDHDVTPADPGWFLSFDDVDSRVIRTIGAPE